MGTGGLRAYSLSHSDKVNAGEQNPLSARQPACEHRRVLGGRSLVVTSYTFFLFFSLIMLLQVISFEK